MIAKYRKFIVAIVGAALIGLNTFLNIDIGFDSEAIVNVLIAILTALGVERVPNEA